MGEIITPFSFMPRLVYTRGCILTHLLHGFRHGLSRRSRYRRWRFVCTPISNRRKGNSSLLSYPCEPKHESQLHHECPSSAESIPSSPTPQDSSDEPFPKPRTSKEEEIQPLKFSCQLEDYLYEILTNTSSYLCDRRPTASLSSPRKSMNEEWLEGMKRSSEVFQISSPSTTISCSIKGTAVEALHDHCRGLHHVRISHRNLCRKHAFRPDRQAPSKSVRTIL